MGAEGPNLWELGKVSWLYKRDEHVYIFCEKKKKKERITESNYLKLCLSDNAVSFSNLLVYSWAFGASGRNFQGGWTPRAAGTKCPCIAGKRALCLCNDAWCLAGHPNALCLLPLYWPQYKDSKMDVCQTYSLTALNRLVERLHVPCLFFFSCSFFLCCFADIRCLPRDLRCRDHLRGKKSAPCLIRFGKLRWLIVRHQIIFFR